jgi:uncharacterized protein YnzC (UPF0291/DUF896 family)
MATQPQRTAIRVLEERLEELEAENESLREEKEYFAGVARQFRDTLSDVEFDDEEAEDEDEDVDEDEDEDEDE